MGRSQRYSALVFLANLLLFALVALVSVFLITIVGHLRFGTPFVPTRRSVAREMITLAHIKANETVFDIGAGDGGLLIEAKRMHPGIRAVGSEVALGVWLYGRLKIFLSGQNVELRLRNAFKDDLRAADVIFLYLGPGMMQKCESKFDAELKPGTRVVSHVFTFPGRKPVAEVFAKQGRKKKRLLLYVW